jgi:hypothetical protein
MSRPARPTRPGRATFVPTRPARKRCSSSPCPPAVLTSFPALLPRVCSSVAAARRRHAGGHRRTAALGRGGSTAPRPGFSGRGSAATSARFIQTVAVGRGDRPPLRRESTARPRPPAMPVDPAAPLLRVLRVGRRWADSTCARHGPAGPRARATPLPSSPGPARARRRLPPLCAPVPARPGPPASALPIRLDCRSPQRTRAGRRGGPAVAAHCCRGTGLQRLRCGTAAGPPRRRTPPRRCRGPGGFGRC